MVKLNVQSASQYWLDGFISTLGLCRDGKIHRVAAKSNIDIVCLSIILQTKCIDLTQPQIIRIGYQNIFRISQSICILNIEKMKSGKSPSSEQKAKALRSTDYFNDYCKEVTVRKEFMENRSSKKGGKSSSKQFLYSTDVFKFLERKHGLIERKSTSNRRTNENFKSPGYSKGITINNIQKRNTDILKNSNTPNLARKHKKRLTGIQSIQNLHSTLRKRKPKSKIYSQKVTQKVIKHRKARSQQIQSTKYFDPDKFVREPQSKPPASKFSAMSKPGMLNGQIKTNQDRYCHVRGLITTNSVLFGVFDGHGSNGHFVSQFVQSVLPKNIEYCSVIDKICSKNCKPEQIAQILKTAFSKTAYDLRRSQINTNFSGTTAVISILIENNLFCANVGDSRAVLCSLTQQKQWRSKPLSRDHNADVPSQWQRIISCKGRLEPYRDENGQQLGPYRVWLETQQIPGLAMTRSFGDFVASTVGVISQPEITHLQINQNDKFMIVASDGLWQFVSNKQAMETVIPFFQKKDSESAARQLEKLAISRWLDQDKQIDDITIIVAFLFQS